MSTFVFSVLFVILLKISVAVRFWLDSRHIRHVLAHRSAVPTEFTEKISLAAHQRAADYTVAKSKFSILSILISTVVLISITLLGGLQLMAKYRDLWWFYAWLIFSGFQLLMLLYPTVIAPLFNKLTPLTDDSLRGRIEGLMKQVGFASKGLFVMDSSKSSAHGNAYLSGFGTSKRIAFFDTLLARLAPQEIEAVLAHELGHFKLQHIVKRIVVMFAISLAFMALLGYLKQQVWFYTGLGVNPLLPNDLNNNNAMALILFMLALPIFTLLLSPLSVISSRKQEFEADAFAAKHTDANYLVSALIKLYEDNASTLTPDPPHSAFYDSHSAAVVRINKLTATHG